MTSLNVLWYFCYLFNKYHIGWEWFLWLRRGNFDLNFLLIGCFFKLYKFFVISFFVWILKRFIYQVVLLFRTLIYQSYSILPMISQSPSIVTMLLLMGSEPESQVFSNKPKKSMYLSNEEHICWEVLLGRSLDPLAFSLFPFSSPLGVLLNNFLRGDIKFRSRRLGSKSRTWRLLLFIDPERKLGIRRSLLI